MAEDVDPVAAVIACSGVPESDKIAAQRARGVYEREITVWFCAGCFEKEHLRGVGADLRAVGKCEACGAEGEVVPGRTFVSGLRPKE